MALVDVLVTRVAVGRFCCFAEVGVVSGVGQQLLGLGGEGDPVQGAGLHPAGRDGPGGGVPVYLVPGRLGGPRLLRAQVKAAKMRQDFSAHGASESRMLARAAPSRL